MQTIKKAKEIYDAKISFVSLVDKAANKRQFLIAKEKGGAATFQTFGKILKTDDTNHYVTGVVYEPMTEDSHENYMTEEEIQKAAYWFAKNGDKVDIQHSFEEMDGATVVETFVAKSDMKIAGEEIKKGTWIMTVEVSDSDIWEKIEKKDITGFSMGGVGKYAAQDIDLKNVQKGNTDENEKTGLLKKLAKAMGLEVVQKGTMKEQYNEKQKSTSFWNAMNTMQDLLCKGHWDYFSDRYIYDFEQDDSKIKEVLSEFTEITTEILSSGNIVKALLMGAADKPVEKAGKKMSGKNKEKLDSLCAAFDDFKREFNEDEEEEEEEVKKEEIEKIVTDSVTKALGEITGNIQKDVTETATEDQITAADVGNIVEDAVAKALSPINEALAPILKSRGLPANLNNQQAVEKQEDQHYMKGMF